ncbi:MAG: LamG domain-containing protein [Armatimonadetes bacterium]|nr:LamG domain-containing protein [Armatimonadota bacterium]
MTLRRALLLLAGLALGAWGLAAGAGGQAEAPPAPRLIAHWEAGAGRDDALPDLTGGPHDAVLVGAKLRNKVEELVEHPCIHLDGVAAHAVVRGAPDLNPRLLTIAAWVLVRPGGADLQKPVLVKSLPSHQAPWYQYGLFVMGAGGENLQLSCYLSLAGRPLILQAEDLVETDTWGMAAATWDGKTARLYWNGQPVAAQDGPAGSVDGYDTPLLLGAYGNLPKTRDYCLGGALGGARLYDGALALAQVRELYEAEKAGYPAAAKQAAAETPYARRLNDALRQRRDVLGEGLIAKGGATYEAMAGLLHPLFFSTGDTYREQGVHNLIFTEDGGRPPYIVPLADGSRIAAPRYDSRHRLEIYVGPDGQEAYGSELDRLDGPRLAGGHYPVLQTGYTDAGGFRLTQESCAGRVPGVDHLVALVRLEVDPRHATAERCRLTIRLGDGRREALRASGEPVWDGAAQSNRYDCERASGRRSFYLLWSPDADLPAGATLDSAGYEIALKGWEQSWDRALSRGTTFQVPEPLVMQAQRNLLIQNLMMRWRYTLGPVVYHGDFYQPESSDTVSTLGLYGFTDACRDGLTDLLGFSKGPGSYTNWERGEKLGHGARYYLLTRDAEFIARHTPEYTAICRALAEQMAGDPHGLLEKQTHCGDIPDLCYSPAHLMVCWRGLRDMALAWQLTGHAAESELAGAAATRLKAAIQRAVDQSATWLPDGSHFVPSILLEQQQPFDPLTATRLGSYWNLVMPYAFASGFWEPDSRELAGVSRYMHQHGGLLLGLLRFNYYPVRIGASRPGGLPGYRTTGFDNVYLPSYQRMLSDRDEADRLVLSFYGKLAHGQTRGTFVNGEGETVGEVPGERYRSCYGTPCSANNTALLLPLRLMLVRESFDSGSGLPRGLYLADATPRGWLAPGKQIQVTRAPTCFGPVSYTLSAEPSGRRVRATIAVPSRDAVATLRLKVRLPGRARLRVVTVNGKSHARFDPARETIDLTGLEGTLKLEADCGPPAR